MIKQLSMRSRAKLALAGAGLFAAVTSVAAQSSMKMVLDWNFEGHHSPYALAADTGIFARNGLAVTVDRGFGSGDSVTKVAAGTYDVGIADLGAVIAFNAKQGGIRLISIYQIYDLAPLAIMSLTENGIRTPADLRSKKLAAPPGDSSRVMFPVFAHANNLDASSIEWTDVTPPLRAALLLQKRVDAITAQYSEVISFRTLGVKDADLIVLRYSDLGVQLYGHAIITTPRYAASHEQELTQFLRSVVQAWTATITNPKASIAVIKKRNGLIDEQVELDRLDLMLREAIGTEAVVKNGFSSVDPSRLKFTADVVTQSFGLPAINAAELYHPQYLPPRNERAYPAFK
jgi:NitT/TauT family transport system substrate-binding protein